MLKKILTTFVLAMLVFTGANLYAAGGDAAKGEQLAKGCKCHKNELNGWSAEKLTQALNEFKTDKRINKFMNKKAKSLSDQDIADLAAWYSSQS